MRGLYIAEGAMLVQQARLALIGNNLANLNSAGFKRDEAVQTSFAEWMLVQTGGVRKDPARPQGLAVTGSAAHSVAVAESYTSFAPGNLNYTGRSLDLALEGRGFFQVETAEGFLYTRDGRFFLDRDGYLATAAGYRVWGEGGPLFLGTEEVDIHPDGSIYAGEEYRGRLRLVAPADGEIPVKVGDNYFRFAGEPVAAEEVQVWARFVESSNTDLLREMTALLQVRRSYEAAQKAMITCDSLLQKAANDLGDLA